ncbi:hypothetical protein IGI04_007136 [Brassica rapa subsp. trilocularis]|uniref:Uncharacterized protein n=1 Tax=Brassica rapa subsp. trilocularis TaxID=1813537 RepID=A0ABQ7NIW0_BRACM|nr:hypothetical protein IGI04_007136 [Brassica rapa subsp. trilocularis]
MHNLHMRVRCLDIDGYLPLSFELYFQYHWFEVNPTVRSEVIPILLESGTSALRDEAVEEANGLKLLVLYF